MAQDTISVWKVRRGWYRITVFSVTSGLTTYKLKGIAQVRDKIKSLRQQETT